MSWSNWTRPPPRASCCFFDAFEDHLFFGPSGSTLTEIALSKTNFLCVVPNSDLGRLIAIHTFHVFAAGSLAPGEYEWRWESDHPESDRLLSKERRARE